MSLAGLRAAGADIMSVRIEKLMPRVFRFDVTVLHEGESHDHYVDRWEILTKQGEIIDVRELVHPHIDEQPFTRSLSHVTIPIGVRDVIVRAHDTVHGYAGQVETVHLDIESRNDAIE